MQSFVKTNGLGQVVAYPCHHMTKGCRICDPVQQAKDAREREQRAISFQKGQVVKAIITIAERRHQAKTIRPQECKVMEIIHAHILGLPNSLAKGETRLRNWGGVGCMWDEGKPWGQWATVTKYWQRYGYQHYGLFATEGLLEVYADEIAEELTKPPVAPVLSEVQIKKKEALELARADAAKRRAVVEVGEAALAAAIAKRKESVKMP